MKIVVIGDIHGKLIWQDILDKENPDQVIFLGDYVSTHGLESTEQQITNLDSILEYKMNNPDTVVLLRGNHDIQHLGYSWAGCSGWDQKLYEMMKSRIDDYLNLTQWVYIDDNLKTIFSHAGISTEWMNQVAKINSIYEINNLPPSEIFGFWPCKLSDYNGISPTQPPTWIRPQTLVEYMPEGWTQVVGHTPLTRLCNVGELMRNDSEIPNCPDLWCCDTLDIKEYLVIEDGVFIPKKLNENESTSN